MRYRALDGWRGLCALGVALFHLNALGHFSALGFVQNSFLLVDFFFVLSGFVITRASADTLGAGRGAGAFLIRRFGRVYPLHFVMLTAFLAMECLKLWASRHGAVLNTPPFAEAKSLATLPSNLLMIQSLGFYDHPTWNFPAWSISVEFWTYVVFALVSVATAGRTRTWLLAGLMLGSWAIVAAFSRHGQEVMADLGFFRCLSGFLAGHFVARVVDRLPRPGRFGTLVEVGATVLAVGFVSVAGTSAIGFAAPLVFAAVVAVFAAEAGALSRWLSTAPLQALGAWSFAIYMLHVFVLENLIGRVVVIAERHFGVALIGLGHDPLGGADYPLILLGGRFEVDLLAITYLAVVIGLAAVAHRVVEIPARAVFRRLADGRLRFGAARAAGEPRASA